MITHGAVTPTDVHEGRQCGNFRLLHEDSCVFVCMACARTCEDSVLSGVDGRLGFHHEQPWNENDKVDASNIFQYFASFCNMYLPCSMLLCEMNDEGGEVRAKGFVRVVAYVTSIRNAMLVHVKILATQIPVRIRILMRSEGFRIDQHAMHLDVVVPNTEFCKQIEDCVYDRNKNAIPVMFRAKDFLGQVHGISHYMDRFFVFLFSSMVAFSVPDGADKVWDSLDKAMKVVASNTIALDDRNCIFEIPHQVADDFVDKTVLLMRRTDQPKANFLDSVTIKIDEDLSSCAPIESVVILRTSRAPGLLLLRQNSHNIHMYCLVACFNHHTQISSWLATAPHETVATMPVSSQKSTNWAQGSASTEDKRVLSKLDVQGDISKYRCPTCREFPIKLKQEVDAKQFIALPYEDILCTSDWCPRVNKVIYTVDDQKEDMRAAKAKQWSIRQILDKTCDFNGRAGTFVYQRLTPLDDLATSIPITLSSPDARRKAGLLQELFSKNHVPVGPLPETLTQQCVRMRRIAIACKLLGSLVVSDLHGSFAINPYRPIPITHETMHLFLYLIWSKFVVYEGFGVNGQGIRGEILRQDITSFGLINIDSVVARFRTFVDGMCRELRNSRLVHVRDAFVDSKTLVYKFHLVVQHADNCTTLNLANRRLRVFETNVTRQMDQDKLYFLGNIMLMLHYIACALDLDDLITYIHTIRENVV